MFMYPWGDMHSLNLGWFLMEFKAWIEKIQEYLDNGGGTSENLANVIAPVFNAANSYLTGDYVLYNDELYKALEPVTPGTWNPEAWERCLVTEEMGSASSGVDNVARLMIAGQYSATYNYQKYAICRYSDKLWMCNTNIPAGGEEWEPSHWDEITVGAGLTGLRRSVETLSNGITNLQAVVNYCLTADVTNVTVIDDATDYNTLTTPGNYVCANQASAQTMVNGPSTQGHRLFVLQTIGNSRIIQLAFINSNTGKLLLRSYTSDGWSSWDEPTYRVQAQIANNIESDYIASRAYDPGDFIAIGANLYKVITAISSGASIVPESNVSNTTVTGETKTLNTFADGLKGIQKFSFGLLANETKTYNIGSSKYGMMFSLGTTSALLEFLIYRANSNGVIQYAQVFNASGLTFSKTTNKLTIANTTSNATQIIFITLNTDTITVES